ncbi:MAG: hypothetical protein ABIN89_14275 [Chitinophagaceae bacterium]
MNKLIVIVMGCCLIACNNNNSKQPLVEEATHDFFPVNNFLKGQVHEVDSLKPPVYKYSTINNKTDTILLTPDEFNSLAEEFMKPDMNDPSIKRFYKETSFADQSIPNITFTYSTLNKDLTLQRMDVIIHPDPILDDQVQSVYLEKITKSNDILIVKKLYWKTSKNFQIISSRQAGDHPAIISQIKVVWNEE